MKTSYGVNVPGQAIKPQGDTLDLITKFQQYLDGEGLPKVLPAKEYRTLGINNLGIFMMLTGTYVLPTEELIDILDNNIDPDDVAVEICAGNGVIGRELDMILTDSHIQTDNEKIREEYLRMGCPPIRYPKDVEKLEATEAVDKYNPDTVLACFGTHLWEPGMRSGFEFGVDYRGIWKKTKKIILVGNDRIHGENPLMKIRHRVIMNPGIITRTSKVPAKIYIWEKQ